MNFAVVVVANVVFGFLIFIVKLPPFWLSSLSLSLSIYLILICFTRLYFLSKIWINISHSTCSTVSFIIMLCKINNTETVVDTWIFLSLQNGSTEKEKAKKKNMSFSNDLC